MTDPIIVRFAPPTLPTVEGGPIASMTSTGGEVRVYGIAVCDPGRLVGQQGYVAISPVLSTGKISDATALYMPREASLVLAVKLLEAEGISVSDLLDAAIGFHRYDIAEMEALDDFDVEGFSESEGYLATQKVINRLAAQANRIDATFGRTPTYTLEEDEEDGEERGDDVCDHCMRSGLAIYAVDDDGETMCAQCAEAYYAEKDKEDEDDGEFDEDDDWQDRLDEYQASLDARQNAGEVITCSVCGEDIPPDEGVEPCFKCGAPMCSNCERSGPRCLKCGGSVL